MVIRKEKFFVDRTSVSLVFCLCFLTGLYCFPSDPMQAVLQSLERQHEEEKRSALERQRQMYEQELQQLRKKLNPDRLSTGPSGAPVSGQQGPGQQSHYRSLERLSMGGMSHSSSAQSRLRQWSEDRWDCLYLCVDVYQEYTCILNWQLLLHLNKNANWTCPPYIPFRLLCLPLLAPSLLLQGGGFGEEFAALEGADSEGKPPGARSVFHRRGAGTTHWVQSHSADPIRQPQRKPQGLTHTNMDTLMHRFPVFCF